MKHISPLGGRLVRAAVCGLLLAAVLPAVAAAETTTATFPFTSSLPSECTGDLVTLDATETITQQTQTDGSLRTYFIYRGSGVGFPSGAVYSFSDEMHSWLFGGPGQVDNEIYDYEKLIRQGETTTPLGGDDMYMRFAFKVVGGVPTPDPRNTGLECR